MIGADWTACSHQGLGCKCIAIILFFNTNFPSSLTVNRSPSSLSYIKLVDVTWLYFEAMTNVILFSNVSDGDRRSTIIRSLSKLIEVWQFVPIRYLLGLVSDNL